jgi:hypothetical protein
MLDILIVGKQKLVILRRTGAGYNEALDYAWEWDVRRNENM